jgi:hypothetical protein
MTDQSSPKRKGGVPPLVWIILALLVAWFVVAMVQRGGTDRTPHGGATPEAAQGPSVMPPAPATGDAPATPGNVANGPSNPTPE